MNKRILVAALAFASAGAFAQTVATLGSLASPYTQDFDALPNAPTSGTGQTGYVAQTGNLGTDFGTSLNGVFARRATGATDRLYVSDGSANTGAFYSAGSAGATERALGSVGSSSTGQLNIGFRIANATGSAISSFYFDFIYEQWRSSNNASGTPEGITLSYRLVDPTEDDATFAASLTNNALWTSEKLSTAYFNGSAGFDGGASAVAGVQAGTAGAFVPARVLGTNVALDGNAEANRRKVESYILLGQNNSGAGGTGFQSLVAGGHIAIRISDIDNPNSDALNGIDNFRAVPEPASMAAMALGLGALAARRRRKNS